MKGTRTINRTLAAIAAVLAVGGARAALAAEYFAVLRGGNEVSPSGQANAGDRDGFGTASVVIVGPSQICFSIIVDQIGTPVLAHIHENVAGQNGPIVVPLTPPSSGNPGTSAGCAREQVTSDVNSAVHDAIRRNACMDNSRPPGRASRNATRACVW